MPARILIVAYGNPLRSDDGVAWHAADALQGKFSESEVEILRLHQLTPEVADALRDRELVLFVDAACIDVRENMRPGEIRAREAPPRENPEYWPGKFSHIYSPARVLHLARDLYSATPRAFVITVAGENFEHGDCLSPAVAAALPELTGTIQRIIERCLTTSETTKDTK